MGEYADNEKQSLHDIMCDQIMTFDVLLLPFLTKFMMLVVHNNNF